ncbi:Lrp/AsnC family transcriptional regulator [Variovorax boronicumulans]|uniref:Lrp/AsnC family transcriptional regulator n=1 Tax=Variovorax boronicumulans TaxID=436515 RepID=UPI001C587214
MARTPHHELDDAAWCLLRALQHDARAPLKTLAEATGLSVAATAERLKRLQESGIAQRFTVALDAAKLGYPVKAIIGITATQPGKKPLLERLRKAPEVLECHHVAGADSYVMTVVATGLADLERFIGTINGYGETRTSIVFSTPIERRGLVAPGSPRRP